MEYLVFVLALAAAAVIAFAKGLWDQRREKAWIRKKLREEFGKGSETAPDPERAAAVQGYFLRHRDGFYIDDITWNDLEMERIFARMDTTKSSAGQEYLYYMLRTPSFSEKELAYRERLIRFFAREEEMRLNLQEIFWKLGKTRKYSIYDYIGFLDQLGKRRNLPHVLGILLFLPVIGIFYVNPAMGVLALVGLIGYNIASYMKDKRAIEPYLVCFKYLFRALEAARKLTVMADPALKAELAEEMGQLKSLLKRFEGLKRSGRYGMHVIGDGSNPMELFTDYLNMILHLDLIGFNLMLKQLKVHEEDVDALLGLLGKLEALVAAAGYRASLPLWCEPELAAGRGSALASETVADFACGEPQEGQSAAGTAAEHPALEICQLYHPLIAEAVKNDIRTERGVLITGSNASGKSTFLKAAAVNTIFAQTIHTCAAASWHSGFWRVMTSMALRDDLESRESYYIVEIKSLKRVLDSIKEPGVPVLCFVDEVLRGTNTVERIAASTQILKSLSGSGVLCFAATHDIELTELLEREYENFHFQEQVENGDIFFPYELMPGRAQTRNAIRLLSIMGYDEKIIGRAEALAAHFLESGGWT